MSETILYIAVVVLIGLLIGGWIYTGYSKNKIEVACAELSGDDCEEEKCLYEELPFDKNINKLHTCLLIKSYENMRDLE